MNSTHRYFKKFALLLVAFGALGMGGCSALFGPSTPPVKEPMLFEVDIEANAQVNPSENGRPSPILVRLYELRNDALFNEADFFNLYNNDKTTLQGDIIAVEQFILRPGEVKQIRRKTNPQATTFGVLVAYRDLPNATWRTSYKLPTARDDRWFNPILKDQKLRLRVDLYSKTVAILDLDTGRSNEPAASQASKSPTSASEPASKTLSPGEEIIEKGKAGADVVKDLPKELPKMPTLPTYK